MSDKKLEPWRRWPCLALLMGPAAVCVLLLSRRPLTLNIIHPSSNSIVLPSPPPPPPPPPRSPPLIHGPTTKQAEEEEDDPQQQRLVSTKPVPSHVLNTLECFSASGEWTFNNTPRPIAWNFAGDLIANDCDKRHVSIPRNIANQEAEMERNVDNWTVREELKWAWRTNENCPFLPFDRARMCRLIGKRNILLVGDSINHELQWTFINHLSTSSMHPPQSQTRGEIAKCRRCISDALCTDVLGGQGLRVAFIRNDRLSPRDDIMEDLPLDFIEWPWLAYIKVWQVGILLLNRGAHYEDDEKYETMLSNILLILRREFPHLLVFYRNTPPGHPDCEHYTIPLERPQSNANTMWNWGDFSRQNFIAKKIVQRNDYIYLDVARMLAMRPDGHLNSKDCLHYCIPGPLDIFVQLFYNTMTLL